MRRLLGWLALAVTVGGGFSADARMHAPYRGHRIVSATAPLDIFTTPAAAYSFRKVRSAYTGPAVRIIRGDNSAEADIGFVGFVPGFGSPFDVAAATAHCAGTQCYLMTAYDQTGNGRHATQATPGSRPGLKFNCIGSQPCVSSTWSGIELRSVSVSWAVGPTSLSAVGRQTVGTTGQCGFVTKSLNRVGSSTTANNWWTTAYSGGQISVAAADNAPHAAAAVINGLSSVLRVDGTEATGDVVQDTAAGAAGFAAGNASTTCDTVEGIVWANYTLTVNERAALIQNQRSFWGF